MASDTASGPAAREFGQRPPLRRLESAAMPVVTYAVWIVLSAPFLSRFWRHPLVAGADGSGHVAALHLYSRHVFPSIQGWLPEPFGGMPFPVFYPPVFYWLGAAAVTRTGLEAASVARLLATASYLALPGVLYWLSRRMELSRWTAAAATIVMGAFASGQTQPAVFGIGLAGIFEIGLFTHTLGFVWFCLWFGSLTRAGRSARGTLTVILSLALVILTNVHLLPLVAACGLCWFFIDWRRGRVGGGAAAYLDLARPALWVLSSLLLAGIWLVPLAAWYGFALGHPFSGTQVFRSLGGVNFLWLCSPLVVWMEYRRRPVLAALAAGVTITALLCTTPVSALVGWLPFQPWRVISGTFFLGLIPALHLLRMGCRLLPLPPAAAGPGLLALALLFCAAQPGQPFTAASLDREYQATLEAVQEGFESLPPGQVLVEVIELSAEYSLREVVFSRALTHGIAMRGRPVSWTIFREHSVNAPFALTVRNLLSKQAEGFGVGGLGIAESTEFSYPLEVALGAARLLRARYFLIRSEGQKELLGAAPGLAHVFTAGQWSVFESRKAPPDAWTRAETTPVLAWLPARFKSRRPKQLDLFNLGEYLVLRGSPEITMMWAQTPGVDVWPLLEATEWIVLVDPSSVEEAWKPWLERLLERASRLRLVLLDDASPRADEVAENSSRFAGFVRVPHGPGEFSRADFESLAQPILRWSDPGRTAGPVNLWRSPMAYFPAWKAIDGGSLWMTAQGGSAAWSEVAPALEWSPGPWPRLGAAASLLGLLLSVLSAAIAPHGQPSGRHDRGVTRTCLAADRRDQTACNPERDICFASPVWKGPEARRAGWHIARGSAPGSEQDKEVRPVGTR